MDEPRETSAPSDVSGLTLVQRFWALYQARRWNEAQALLAPAAHCTWWTTGERFEGAPAIVQVNAIYPEGWTLHLLALHSLGPNRVHSLVRVDHGAAQFYANSFFELTGVLIAAIDEYWSDVQPAPAWRQTAVLPGRQTLLPDGRQGLDLTLC